MAQPEKLADVLRGMAATRRMTVEEMLAEVIPPTVRTMDALLARRRRPRMPDDPNDRRWRHTACDGCGCVGCEFAGTAPLHPDQT